MISGAISLPARLDMSEILHNCPSFLCVALVTHLFFHTGSVSSFSLSLPHCYLQDATHQVCNWRYTLGLPAEPFACSSQSHQWPNLCSLQCCFVHILPLPTYFKPGEPVYHFLREQTSNFRAGRHYRDHLL